MYFEKPGSANTEDTIALAVQTAKDRGISTIVVASYSGKSALDTSFRSRGVKVVCVTAAYGADKPGQSVLDSGVRTQLELAGVSVLAATHVLSGAERCFSGRFGGVYPTEIMSYTLKMMGQGTKVAVECAVMALDAGLIPYGEPVLSLGGTDSGLDTALLLTPAHGKDILSTKIHEVICKPYL